jgi:ubiquitin-like protein Pup
MTQKMTGKSDASASKHHTMFEIVRAADSTQKQKPDKGGSEGEAKGDGPTKMAKKGDKLKEEMDALVDEIDEVLEENAEEFVKNYVQRGGQ